MPTIETKSRCYWKLQGNHNDKSQRRTLYDHAVVTNQCVAAQPGLMSSDKLLISEISMAWRSTAVVFLSNIAHRPVENALYIPDLCIIMTLMIFIIIKNTYNPGLWAFTLIYIYHVCALCILQEAVRMCVFAMGSEPWVRAVTVYLTLRKYG